MNLDNKFDLGFFPTPLHKLKNLSLKLADYNVFIKRDDHTGLATGGNKTRKLEYLLQDALNKGCDTVITAGAQQSNHCRQTAAACSIAGIKCYLMVAGEEPKHYEGNLLLSKLFGAEIIFAGNERKGEGMENLKKNLENTGKKSYVIPYGGSNVIGALGYVNAVKELKEQLLAQNIKIDYVFFATSSGGMQAGLTLGIDIFNALFQLMPINIDKDETHGLTLEQTILNIINDAKPIFKLNKEYLVENILVIRDYDKAGYGVVTTNEKIALNMLAKNEGILLDPVYTGRAFYGMIDYLERKRITPGSNILFWHTGGLPANFYYSEQIL